MLSSAWSSSERRSLLRVTAYVLVTRIALWLVGYWVVRYSYPPLQFRVRAHGFSHSTAVVGWLRWDVSWYASIVDLGYRFDPKHSSNIAFMPGFPALVAALRIVFRDTLTAGIVGANLSFVGSIAALWSWVNERAGAQAAERAVVYLLLFPLSFFLNTAYAESLFFFACTMAFRNADRGRWASAGIFASVATLTRPMGILLAPAFACALLRPLRARVVPHNADMGIGLPFVALGSFAVYEWLKFGTLFATLTSHQVGWGVGNLNLPWLHLRSDTPTELLDVLQIVLPFLLGAACFETWRRFGVAPAVYGACAAAIGIFLGGDSLGRETLAVVPAFAAAGVPNPGPVASVLLRVASFALLITFAYAFVMGRFMG